MQDIICTVEPYTSHDLARKNAKFTGIPRSSPLSLPVTPRWEGVVRQGEATHRAFKLKVVYNVQCLQANRLYRGRAFPTYIQVN